MEPGVFLLFLLFGSAKTVWGDCPCVNKTLWQHEIPAAPQQPIQVAIDALNDGTISVVIETDECVPTFSIPVPSPPPGIEMYLSRMITYFIPPVTQDYTFYLLCDNVCVLNVDGNPVAEVTSYKIPNKWNKAEKSAPISLTAGTCVELITYHMEGISRDFLDVGVKYASGTQDFPMSQYICNECPCDDNDEADCNEGECENTGATGAGFECNCNECYEGDNCETQITPCDEPPCGNNAICTNDPDVATCHTCTCPDCLAMDGNGDCVATTPCDDNPCGEGATCSYDAGSENCYTCTCPACQDFDGNGDCVATTPCDSTPCGAGATCSYDASSEDCYTCTCPTCQDFDDNGDCEATTPCDSTPCGEGASCSYDASSEGCYTCTCPACQDFDGNGDCVAITPCNSDSCGEGATCSYDASSDTCYSCTCPACQDFDDNGDCVDVNSCESVTCPPKGVCKYDNSDPENCYRCEGCMDRWASDYCAMYQDKLDAGTITAAELALLAENCRYSSDFCCSCHEAACDVMYVKLGCWKDKRKPHLRRLGDLMLTDRDRSSPVKDLNEIPWGEWVTYMPGLTCRCAKKALENGYNYFSIQFYGECWGATDPDYDEFGGPAPNTCNDRGWGNCTWPGRPEETVPNFCCAGQANTNYVYYIPSSHTIDTCLPEV